MRPSEPSEMRPIAIHKELLNCAIHFEQPCTRARITIRHLVNVTMFAAHVDRDCEVLLCAFCQQEYRWHQNIILVVIVCGHFQSFRSLAARFRQIRDQFSAPASLDYYQTEREPMIVRHRRTHVLQRLESGQPLDSSRCDLCFCDS